MAAPSRISRQGDVQKAFYMRVGLDARLTRVVAERRKKDRKFTERRALEVAIRSFVEKEEQELGLSGSASPSELVDVIAEATAQLRAHVGARRA